LFEQIQQGLPLLEEELELDELEIALQL